MYFYIYILYSKKGDRYYVGYSDHPWERLIEHNTTSRLTYTSKFRPWSLMATFRTGTTENEAIRVERVIKRQKSRKLIERLINTEFVPTGYLAQLVRVPHVRD